MIDPNNWDTDVTDIVAHTFEIATLPVPHVAKASDNEFSYKGTRLPYTVNRVKTLGTPGNTLRSSYGVHIELQLNNAYDVILLDTMENITTSSQG